MDPSSAMLMLADLEQCKAVYEKKKYYQLNNLWEKRNYMPHHQMNWHQINSFQINCLKMYSGKEKGLHKQSSGSPIFSFNHTYSHFELLYIWEIQVPLQDVNRTKESALTKTASMKT